jgi:DNA (cytosine-5)-methyltransferase 1
MLFPNALDASLSMEKICIFSNLELVYRLKKKKIESAQVNSVVVDLFCGIGGLSYGFKAEKFHVTAGIDIDEYCKYPYEFNNDAKFIAKDIATVTGKEIDSYFIPGKIKVLVGCAPCQPFSSLTFKDKNRENGKWSMLYHFSRIIKEVKPEIVSMENVAQLLNFKKAPVFEDFVSTLKKEGYYVHFEVINCLDYGIPQKRRRLVLLASKLGEIKIIPKTHNRSNYRTVKDTIGDLPKIQDGQFDKNDIMHFARKLDPINKERIRHTPYGGSWKDWPDRLILACHKKKSGKSYSSVYGRMRWEEPAPTITTHCLGFGNGRFGHPVQNRGISLREAALIQTFPKKYKFFESIENFKSSAIARQLGNAVPVELGRVIAKSIKQHLEIHKSYE